ncbi:MAG: hypothetical protein WCS30_13445 [Selenomonadaceae bacterium]
MARTVDLCELAMAGNEKALKELRKTHDVKNLGDIYKVMRAEIKSMTPAERKKDYLSTKARCAGRIPALPKIE